MKGNTKAPHQPPALRGRVGRLQWRGVDDPKFDLWAPCLVVQCVYECVCVCVCVHVSTCVCVFVWRCQRRSGVTEQTDRQTGRRPAGVSGHTPVTTHHTPGSRIPQHPHRVHTMSAQSPASRTSGSSNVKYSHRDKR